jgi:serine/threonine-protein kinase
MSAQKDESTSPDPGEGESDGSDFESWLRQAARGVEPAKPVLLPKQGQIIAGKYRIEEQLGRGGMGAVFRATHTVSAKAVALKWMLRPASDERAAQRFTREAQAAGRIDHPNVVDIYDLGQEGDAGYLVMELLRGESLRARLARGPLAPTEAVDLLLPAFRGVAAAHREGVVHRDLKPDNVFLCRAPDGAAREAKVLDFGISSITTSDCDAQPSLTKEGTVLGTPAYMSPEQLQSAKDADARTDVYALGVILYEALTGSPPFAAESYSALVLAIANETPKSPRALRSEIPATLERVVLRAMHKDKTARLQTVDALIAELLPFASVPSSGSGEHPSRELGTASIPGMRSRSSVAWLGVAAVLIAALIWWFARGSAPAAEPTAVDSARAAPRAIAALPAAEAPAVTPAIPPPVPAVEPQPRPTPASEPAAAAAAQPVRPSRAHKPASRNTAGPAAPAPAAPGPPSAQPARSGRIAMDDL